MYYLMLEEQVQRQLDALKAVREKALNNPEYARQFLAGAGLLRTPGNDTSYVQQDSEHENAGVNEQSST